MITLACDKPDIAKAFVGVSFKEVKVCICIRLMYTTAFHTYSTAKYVLLRFSNLKLMVKAGHCASPYHKGTVVCYDRYNSALWPPKGRLPVSSDDRPLLSCKYDYQGNTAFSIHLT